MIIILLYLWATHAGFHIVFRFRGGGGGGGERAGRETTMYDGIRRERCMIIQ